MRTEEGQSSDIDGVGRVLRVDNNGGSRLGNLAVGAKAGTAKEIFGVRQVGFLFSASQALTALALGLFLIGLSPLLSSSTGTLGLMFSNTSTLGFLVGGSGSGGGGLDLGSLALLLTFCLGVFSGIPRFKNLTGRSMSATEGTSLRQAQEKDWNVHHCHPPRRQTFGGRRRVRGGRNPKSCRRSPRRLQIEPCQSYVARQRPEASKVPSQSGHLPGRIPHRDDITEMRVCPRVLQAVVEDDLPHCLGGIMSKFWWLGGGTLSICAVEIEPKSQS